MSQRTWRGDYGQGRAGVLAQAKATYKTGRRSIAAVEYIVAYASTLYSVVQDPAAWRITRPLGLIAAWRLYALLRKDLPRFFSPGGLLKPLLVPDQCETMATILLQAARVAPSIYWRKCFRLWGKSLVNQGLCGVDEHTSSHTHAFLLVHSARVLCQDERVERKTRRPKGHSAPSVVEDLEQRALELLRRAIKYAKKAADPNQQSRCYRNIAVAYAERHELGKAQDFFKLMDEVPSTDPSTRRKNFAARSEWGF